MSSADMSDLSIIQCDPEVPAGVIAELLAEWQVAFALVRADLGERLPAHSAAVIVLGGAMGVHDEDRHAFLGLLKKDLLRLLADGTPLLGICLGGQLLAEAAGGLVTSCSRGEKGLAGIDLTGAGLADPLFAGMERSFQAFQWHNDSFDIPLGATHLAATSTCSGQAFRIGNAWGIQFHPEVDRMIIDAWSERAAANAGYLEQFLHVEAAHRELCRKLLANFLALAGLRAC